MPQTIESKPRAMSADVSVHARGPARVRPYAAHEAAGTPVFIAATLPGSVGASIWSNDAGAHVATIRGEGEGVIYLSPEQARVLAAELLAAAGQLEGSVEVAA